MCIGVQTMVQVIIAPGLQKPRSVRRPRLLESSYINKNSTNDNHIQVKAPPSYKSHDNILYSTTGNSPSYRASHAERKLKQSNISRSVWLNAWLPTSSMPHQIE